MSDGLRGLTPSIQDILAILIIFAAYVTRIGGAGDPSMTLPWWLTITTDFILPVIAGGWLFITAFFVVLAETGRA